MTFKIKSTKILLQLQLLYIYIYINININLGEMGNKKKHQRQRKQRGQDEIQNQQERQRQDQGQDKKQMGIRQQPKNQEQKKFEVVPPKKVSYCPACSFPFQLCRYGKNPNACIKVLYDLAPAKVTKYHPDFKEEDITAIKKQIKQAKKQESLKEQKKQKTVKDKYVVIDTKNRGKKKHVTTISGLNIFNIDEKDFTKKCSKKFACSCSAIEDGVAQIQGQFFEEIKQILIMEYKVKKKYIIDGQEYKEKFNAEMQKKKEERKLKGNEIKQVDEKEEEEIKEKQPQTTEGEQLPKVEQKLKNRLGFQIRSDSQEQD